jgi:excisionase family DNA binding protein
MDFGTQLNHLSPIGGTMNDKATLLDEKEAAKYLNISVRTLRGRRWDRKPPTYHRIGRLVRYDRTDLDAFLDRCRIEL